MKLEILSDLSEIVPYSVPEFPLYAGTGILSVQNKYAVGCHFHPDFEFSLVLEGTMDYFINGENVHLETGDGIFVNSKRLHYNYSSDLMKCKYLVITVSPELFPKGVPAVEQFLNEKSDMKCTDYVLLKKESCKKILSIYPEILQQVQSGNHNVFLTLSYVMEMCSMVMPMLRKNAYNESRDGEWVCLNEMTDHIHKNYRENISLSDIAAAGRICRSKCCQLFTRVMGQSPVEYLIFYRLKKSQALLINSDCSIGEVALSCGFSGQSYYTQMFKKHFCLTPKEYRKSQRK